MWRSTQNCVKIGRIEQTCSLEKALNETCPFFTREAGGEAEHSVGHDDSVQQTGQKSIKIYKM